MSGPVLEFDEDDDTLEPWARGMHIKEVVFVREWLIDMNTTRAGLASGISSNHENARSNSWKIVRRPTVLKAIAAAMDERAKALRITAQTVLGEAWNCYVLALSERQWSAAHKFLMLAGQHVDVGAFKARFGTPNANDFDEDDNADDLKNLTLEELETLERITRKAAGIDDPQEQPASPVRH